MAPMKWCCRCLRCSWTLPWRVRSPNRRYWPVFRLAAQLAIAVGVLNILWACLFAGQGNDATGAAHHHTRDGRVFDGGIKLRFTVPRRLDLGARPGYHEGRITCNGSTTCLKTQTPPAVRSEYGNAINMSRRDNQAQEIDEHAKGVDPDVNSAKSTTRTDAHPFWCSGGGSTINSTRAQSGAPEIGKVPPGKKFFLTAVLLVRIYADDPAKLTTREMVQWLQYLRYAGVEHVYVYDAYTRSDERQRDILRCFIRNGYVTYVDWSRRAYPKYTIAGTQVAAYQDSLSRYGRQFAWQTAIDIDEYPFCPNDHSPGFLRRAVEHIARTRGPRIGEISMQNYLYLGKPLNKTEHPILVDRLWRRTIKRANPLVKPIYQPVGVRRANVHHNSLSFGYQNHSPRARFLRMNHYWGARLQNWGNDTQEILNMTMEDRGMTRAVDALKACQSCELGCCP